MSFGNFLAEIKIEFHRFSSPKSVSVQNKKKAEWCGAERWCDNNQSNPISDSTVLLCQRDASTVSVPWHCRDVRGCGEIEIRDLRLRSSSKSLA